MGLEKFKFRWFAGSEKLFFTIQLLTKLERQRVKKHRFGDNYLTSYLVKFLQDKIQSWGVGALIVCTGCQFFKRNSTTVSEGFLTSFNFSHAVVDVKPIYLNKHYLFQNKIYYLDKIYFCFAKLRKVFQTYSV